MSYWIEERQKRIESLVQFAKERGSMAGLQQAVVSEAMLKLGVTKRKAQEYAEVVAATLKANPTLEQSAR